MMSHAGNYTIRILASLGDYQPVENKSVIVGSNEMIDIGKIDFLHLSQWKFSRRIYLNTSSTGADIAGMVTNFPVLLRLRANSFDFSQAKRDGGDIRFTSSSGIPLPYEIERWDSIGREAEEWVRVDTVQGNNDSQFIIMYWGNPDAQECLKQRCDV